MPKVRRMLSAASQADLVRNVAAQSCPTAQRSKRHARRRPLPHNARGNYAERAALTLPACCSPQRLTVSRVIQLQGRHRLLKFPAPQETWKLGTTWLMERRSAPPWQPAYGLRGLSRATYEEITTRIGELHAPLEETWQSCGRYRPNAIACST